MLDRILKKESVIVLNYEQLHYNPCNDIIFPSVINVSAYIRKPLGKYYLYYSPHNAPGGICLAYSDDLNGEWTEYKDNPIISNIWKDNYEVEHVSSPHIIYLEEKKQFFLYFHGDNDKTRYAYSDNAKDFKYGSIILNANIRNQFSGLSYARVFKLGKNNNRFKYIMFYLGYTYIQGSWTEFKSFGLYYSVSKDCIDWVHSKKPIISQKDIEKDEFVCSPFYLCFKGKDYLLFHKDKRVNSDICYIKMNNEFSKISDLKTLCSYSDVFKGNFRLSDPCPIIENNILYMFVSTGKRLNQNIGLIKYRI